MPIIKVENLSKKYVLVHQNKRYVALRDVITQSFSGWGKKIFYPFKREPNPLREEFWALKNVSFEIKEGELVGIIGRNGAGKSTLLKILSRITHPTQGKVSIKGRVASLLEVGTGFHPELTGRENIYLNGAVLGMRRSEIKRKFDEIVAFSEVEKFLDTPVKRYSSGMYVRLAFAVAAHLEPEILLVDEVLAVGDVQFQKKCLGKMEDVSRKEARTVIFVSHNMDAIRRLCHRAILLENGEIINDGDAASVVDGYLMSSLKESKSETLRRKIKQLPSDSIFRLNDIDIRQDNQSTMHLLANKDVEIEFNYDVLETRKMLFISFELKDMDGKVLTETFHNGSEENPVVYKGAYVSKAIIPANYLTPVTYELVIHFGVYGDRNFFKDPISIILDIHSNGESNMVYLVRPLGGKFVLPIKWDTKQLN